MIKFDIKNRFTGAVQFTAELDCSEDESTSVKIGLAAQWAVTSGTNLRGAYLGGAYLGGADLRGADLGGAYLGGAHGLNDYVKTLCVGKYHVAYTATHMRIGCQNHTLDDWRRFTAADVNRFETGAGKNWDRDKALLFQIIDAFPAKPTKPTD